MTAKVLVFSLLIKLRSWYLYFISLKMISFPLFICMYIRATAEDEVEVVAMKNRLKPSCNFVLLIVPRRYVCGGSFSFLSWCLKLFVLLAPYVCFHILVKFR